MVNTRIGLGIFGASCRLAAGGGGYLASRHAAAPAPQVAATAPATAGSSADESKPVKETEAVLVTVEGLAVTLTERAIAG